MMDENGNKNQIFGIIITNEEGKIVEINHSISQLLKKEKDEIIFQNLRDFLVAENDIALIDHCYFNLSEKRNIFLVFNFKTGKHTKFLSNTFVERMIINENKFFVFILYPVIGTRSEISRLREESSNLSTYIKRMVTFSQYLYEVHHDLRSYVVSISGILNLLEEEYRSSLTKDGLEYINRIKINVKYLNILVDSAIEFSKLDAHIIKKKKINIFEIIDDILYQFKDRLTENKIMVKLQISEKILSKDYGEYRLKNYNLRKFKETLYDKLPIIIGEENLIIRVFSNLIDNQYLAK